MSSSRTVIPHYLKKAQVKPKASVQTKSEMSLRMGRVVAVHYTDDKKTSNKKTTEYDVEVYYTTSKDRTSITYNHVKVSSLFGGAADHLRWTPRLSTDETEGTGNDTFKSINLGSIVVLACMDGNMRSGLIVAGWPHPNADADTDKDDGHNLKFQFNGLDIKINKDGELLIERKGPTKPNGKPETDNDDAAGSKIKMDKEGTVTISTPKNKQTIVVNHKDNKTIITSEHIILDSKKIELGGMNLSDAVALAPKTKTEIKSLRDWCASHTHDSNDKFAGMGSVINLPVSPPSSGPPQVGDVGAENVKGK